MNTSQIIVFLGPTMDPADASKILDADYRPPAAQGDVFQAVADDPLAIGLVDGYFERVPSVWHKELLYAMSQGVHCYGAASMGALRAAELAAFGMVGIGEVFKLYSSGALRDDDEVAIIHDPHTHGQQFQTEAMVNIRATLIRAAEHNVISEDVGALLICEAKSLFYAERSYPRILRMGRYAGVPNEALHHLQEWLPDGSVDIKRQDAYMLLQALSELSDERPGPMRPTFDFEDTSIWRKGISELKLA